MVAVKTRQIKIEVLLGTVLVLVGTGAAGILLRPLGEPDQVLKARFGDVVWNHGIHARMKDIGNCTVCHHKERQGVTNPRPCSECHKRPDNRHAVINAGLWGVPPPKPHELEDGTTVPFAQEAFHGKCMGCHKAMKKGPAACRDCHAQTFVGDMGQVSWDHRLHARFMYGMDCVYCHHQDGEAKTPDEYRPCRECHRDVDTMEKTQMETGIENHEEFEHLECHACHTVTDPEEGARFCLDCHQKMRPALPEGASKEDHPPSIEEAIHIRCLECHNKDYADLTPGMPAICADCHKPDPSFMDGGTAGPVLWPHERHADFSDFECSECHHPNIPGEPHLACYRCHGSGDYGDIPSLKDALHKRCTECHAERDRAGPSDEEDCHACHSREEQDLHLYRGRTEEGECWWDHLSHANAFDLSCRECHHNTYMRNRMPFTVCTAFLACPEEANDIQGCRKCHGERGPGPLGERLQKEPKEYGHAMKTACGNCHDELEIGPADCNYMLLGK